MPPETLTLEQIVGHTLRKWDGIVLAGREDDGVKAWLAVIRAALEAAVAEERAALREDLSKMQGEIVDLANGFAHDALGNPRSYHQREAAGVRAAIAVLDTRASADAGKPEPALPVCGVDGCEVPIAHRHGLIRDSWW